VQFAVLLVTYNLWKNGKVTVWTDPKEGHTVRVIENECWLIVSWLVETIGTEHSPPAATVLVAAPSGWCSVVLLVQYLQNLHDCFVPLHCQYCIIIALRMFHVNLSFGLEANYNDWYVHDFIQSVHITHSFKCLNLPVHKLTTMLLSINHCQ